MRALLEMPACIGLFKNSGRRVQALEQAEEARVLALQGGARGPRARRGRREAGPDCTLGAARLLAPGSRARPLRRLAIWTWACTFRIADLHWSF
eukprot:CAMPEP_0171221084 /NCGR_PEP_ID=MMETSP0790-20130122/34574_1 /TAXON_ID=2925 /ORGANISM="Alexandrium catenella, Strain OF101" /LENGTH=93 /DNA_ID=CAMNT_0011687005 /DNA_START=26 /DNA_END=307 /DNA_ORIENTATION=+